MSGVGFDVVPLPATTWVYIPAVHVQSIPQYTRLGLGLSAVRKAPFGLCMTCEKKFKKKHWVSLHLKNTNRFPRLCYVGFVDSGYWYGSLTEFPEVSGTGMEVLQNSRTFRVVWHGRTERTEVPGGYTKCCTRTQGIVARGVQSSQRFRVRV